MVTLNNERIEEILHKETAKKEELDTILRSIYTRHMWLYEQYFADIDALNDDKIAALRNYHEETKSLVRYFYMDIPQDICKCLVEFDSEYTEKLLGSEWQKYLLDIYNDFKKKNNDKDKSEQCIKTEFKNETMDDFYDAMDYIFRSGFGTSSQAANDLMSGIAKLLFGNQE